MNGKAPAAIEAFRLIGADALIHKRDGVIDAARIDLVGKLADVRVMDSEPNIRNKISRGKFTAVFLVQCLTAIGVNEVRI